MTRIILQISLALLFISTISDAASSSTETNENVDRNTVVQSPALATHTSSEIASLPGNLLSMLANGGTIVAGALAFAVVAMLLMPMFGFRACSILGGCDSAQGYYNNDVYNSGGYGQSPLYTPSTYQKRSLEYVGPILKALSNAYDKYGQLSSATASVKKS